MKSAVAKHLHIRWTGPFSVAALLFLATMLVPGCKHEPVEPPIVDDGGGGGGGTQPLVDDSLWLTTQPPINSTPCAPGSVYFQNTVFPILVAYCTTSGCHGAPSPQDGVGLFNYAVIMDQVQPGDPGNSDLWDRGINETGNDAMPPSDHPQLTPAQEQAIFDWIQQGAPNNACNSCDTTVISYASDIRPIFQNKCNGCHGGQNVQGGWDFTNDQVVRSATLSNAVEGAVKHLPGYSHMPPYEDDSFLPACDIIKLMKWKRAGAPL